jgi:hypothetical protein
VWPYISRTARLPAPAEATPSTSCGIALRLSFCGVSSSGFGNSSASGVYPPTPCHRASSRRSFAYVSPPRRSARWHMRRHPAPASIRVSSTTSSTPCENDKSSPGSRPSGPGGTAAPTRSSRGHARSRPRPSVAGSWTRSAPRLSPSPPRTRTRERCATFSPSASVFYWTEPARLLLTQPRRTSTFSFSTAAPVAILAPAAPVPSLSGPADNWKPRASYGVPP